MSMDPVSLLLGELKEGNRAMGERLDRMEDAFNGRFDGLEKKMDSVQKWRWKRAGSAATLTLILGVLLDFFLRR